MIGVALFFIAAFISIYGGLTNRRMFVVTSFMVMLILLFADSGVADYLIQNVSKIGGPISNVVK